MLMTDTDYEAVKYCLIYIFTKNIIITFAKKKRQIIYHVLVVNNLLLCYDNISFCT